jgi:hypothetical protein
LLKTLVPSAVAACANIARVTGYNAEKTVLLFLISHRTKLPFSVTMSLKPSFISTVGEGDLHSMNTRHSPQQAGESPRSPMASLSVLVRRFCYQRLARHRRDMLLDSTRGLYRDATATFWRATQITSHSILVFLNEWGNLGSVRLCQKIEFVD